MSKPAPYPSYPSGPYQSRPPAEQSESNVVGLVGFILTLVSIATCFTLSPIGLLISLIGVRKRPRTMALVGTYLGLAFTVILSIAAAVLLSVIFAGRAGVIVLTESAKNEKAFMTAKADIEERWLQLGTMPEEADGNKIAARHKDAWGNPLRFERQGELAHLVSAGPDGQFDSGDDLQYGDDF